MILDYLNRVKLTEPARSLEEEEIAALMPTRGQGTELRDVMNINSALNASNPSLEFETEYQSHTLADIRKELVSGLPVVVYIVTNDGSSDYLHAVVITGIDDDKKEISYNDPAYGAKKTMTQSKFMDAWESPGARMIKAKIGRVPRETLEKYMPQETSI